MNALHALALIYIFFSWLIIALLLFFIIFRNYRAAKQKRKKYGEVEKKWFPKTLKVLFGLTVLTFIPNAIFYGYIGSAFKSIIPGYLNHLLIFTTVLFALSELRLTFSISFNLLEKKAKKIWLALLILIFLPVSFSSAWEIPKMFSFPEKEDCYLIDLPIQGTWLGGHAGAWEAINAHQGVRSQWYAIDIVKVDEHGNFFTREGKMMEDFPTFNAHIYAPVDGRIVEMVDSLPNKAVNFMPHDTLTPAGNHVVIEFENDRYLFLAHLNYGTIEVEKGDYVKRGDLIGRAGNSGNTSWPHLHMHIQDMPVINNREAKGFPFRFRRMERKRWLKWEEVSDAFIIRNDLFRDQ